MKNSISDKMLQKIKNLEENLKFIKRGCTSSTFSSPFLFIKYIIKLKEYHIYEREKHISSILTDFDWCPKLLYCDDINQFFVYSNVGIPVTPKNKPDDLEEQFNKILTDLESVNVQHNDIKIGEILVNEDNKIFLCDFGWASINNELGCGIGIWTCNNTNKPGGYYDDATTLKRLKLI